jgi:NADH:ubiquinone oxidoreductase subunit D
MVKLFNCWIVTEIGLLHRGTEKLIDLHYYNCSIPYFDRLDYVSTITQELLFIQAVERLLSCYGSLYDSTLRTIFLEFYRLLNHLLAITTHALDIGLFNTILWSFEEREKLINFIEVLTGNRFHAAYLLISRCRYDISFRWIDCFLLWILLFSRKLKEIHLLLSINYLWISRLYEIGIINRDYCYYYGISGVISRSASIKLDARLLGYECYNLLDYSIFLSTTADCLDRYLLRINEMIESLRITYALSWIWCNTVLRRRLIDYSINYTSSSSINLMEWLITEFLIGFPFILSFDSGLNLVVESSKGIYSIFINCFPIWTTNIITNDLLYIYQLNLYCRCINLGDLIAVLGSIDFVLGSVDLRIIVICVKKV